MSVDLCFTAHKYLGHHFAGHIPDSISSICNIMVYSESRPQYDGFMGGVNYYIAHVTRTRKDCDRKCAMSLPCKGYTFDGVTQECHLLNFTLSNTVGLTPRTGAVYYARIKASPGAFICPKADGNYHNVPTDDGCLDIRAVHTYKNHNDAEADCEATGGRLFVINNVERRSLFMSIRTCQGFSSSYIVDGRNDNATDFTAVDAFRTKYGTVVPIQSPLWIPTGSSFYYYSPTTQHCLFFDYDHHHTYSCTSTRYFLCERSP